MIIAQKTPTIQVWFNSGEARAPWHVGIHDGTAIAETFSRFSEPVSAIRYALDTVSESLELPVIWPENLKVIVN
jgi:hypothetical protein